MSTISGTVYSTLSALNTYSVAINVTSTNVSNAESTGYSKRTAVITEKVTADGTGYGVDVSTIERSYDSFLTSQLRSANQELGKSSVEQESLTSIEQVFSDSGSSGLSSVMGDFWNAWQNVVNDPSSSTTRSVLASSASTLADTFNSMSSELSHISTGVESSIDDTVSQINDLVTQIADTNHQLAMKEATGQDANSSKDTLDSLVQKLSSLIDIKTSTNDVGQISIKLSNNEDLVEADGTTTHALSTKTNATTGLLDIYIDSDPLTINASISSGKLGGYLEVRDQITNYQEQLDTLAKTIITQVNTLHASGYDLYGNKDGISFFTGSDAGDIAVNTDIVADPGKITAASTAAGGTGDGSNAKAIAELQNSLLLNTGTSTFSDYYNTMVSKIGSAVAAAKTSYESSSSAQEYYTNQCQSVSGVSSDEEMAKMVLYQNAYNAAAKIMTTLEEMMKTLIDM